MISLEEAQSRVWSRVAALEPVSMHVREALGCVLADDVIAKELIPPFDNSSVDGFALRSADVETTPVELAVIGEVRAGAWPTRAIGPGQVVRIMTGAPIPEGADAVAMVEDSEPGAAHGSVRILKSVAAGEAIRPAGDDVAPGDLVLRAGTVLGPAHLGLLAELGCLEVRVHRRLRVGVISTGDELVDDGSELRPGQIRESNGELISGLLAMANCEVVNFGIVADEEDALTAALVKAAAECDAVVTSGGVSMGDYDLVKVLLDQLGDMDWMQIAIRPAKPFAFGLLGPERTTPVFGLPGNPVSSMVSFELLARPALLKMMGHTAIERPKLRAVADKGVRRNRSDDRVNFVRVIATIESDGRVHVATSGAQGSHQLAASAAANGLVRVEVSSEVAPGDEVDVLLIGVAPGQL
jgi:molybdenum cofactor synthesis domain-containing protein